MSILNAGVLNKIAKNTKGFSGDVIEGSLTLPVGEEVITPNFIAPPNAKAYLYTITWLDPQEIEITTRYLNSSNEITGFEKPVKLAERYEGGFSVSEIPIKAGKVNLKFLNNSLNSVEIKYLIKFSLSDDVDDGWDKTIVLLPESNMVNGILPNENITTKSIEIKSEFISIGFFAKTFPSKLEVTVRYHLEEDAPLKIGISKPYIIDIKDNWEHSLTVPILHPFVSFRFKNLGNSTLGMSDIYATPRNTLTETGGGYGGEPVDGSQLVKFDGGVDSDGYDEYYGSFKTLRTYKSDFKLVLSPPTIKKDSTPVNNEFTLQYGVEHVRIYLKVTVTGNPFPSDGDGVKLNVSLSDGEDYETLVIDGDVVKDGTKTYLLGVNETLMNGSTTKHLFGSEVKTELIANGTINDSNFFTYEILTFQKFK